MTQGAVLEFLQVVPREYPFGDCALLPPVAGLTLGPSRTMERSEARDPRSAPLWVTSLHRPGVFELVPTENISRSGMKIVTREFWEPEEPVLLSSPPGFCIHGSVVYCKKLPSDNYFVGISLDAPVEDWTETLGLVES
jgi:hypothetical protein